MRTRSRAGRSDAQRYQVVHLTQEVPSRSLVGEFVSRICSALPIINLTSWGCWEGGKLEVGVVILTRLLNELFISICQLNSKHVPGEADITSLI